jgi:glyoxylate utilization-related uncharacterized protein
MTTTKIETASIPRSEIAGQGEFAEILNKELCGAENVVGTLRWLSDGDRFEAEAMPSTHQLLYLMDGDAVIELNSKNYDVGRGAGIYLGPNETASIKHRGTGQAKLFHLVVPIREELQLDA